MGAHGRASSWRRQRNGAVCAVLLCGAASLVLAASFRDDRPRLLSLALAAVAVLGCAVVFFARDHVGPALAFTAVAYLTCVIGIVVAVTESDIVRVLNMGFLIALSVFVGWYFGTEPRARLYGGVHLGGTGVVAVIAVLVAERKTEIGWTVATFAVLSVVTLVAVVRLRIRENRAVLTDSLTGAMNRRGLDRFVSERTPSPNAAMVLIALDVDDFKKVNDRDGHHAGDDLLVSFAQHWRSCIRAEDRIARTGGDEFLVILTGTDEVTARTILTAVRAASPVSFSAGIATVAADGAFDAAYARADVALYREKLDRKAGVVDPDDTSGPRAA